MFKFKVTLVNYDKKKNFSYEVEAANPWDAFLKQPCTTVTCWQSWTFEQIEVCNSDSLKT